MRLQVLYQRMGNLQQPLVHFEFPLVSRRVLFW
jgi:hypothetical protein